MARIISNVYFTRSIVQSCGAEGLVQTVGVTLAVDRFVNYSAADVGGAICLKATTSSVIDRSTFAGNGALTFGGAIYT